MHSTFALAALAAVAYAAPAPQGVTQKIPPKGAAPAGCSGSYNGKFQIAAVALQKRDVEKRQSDCGSAGSLTITLADGVLLDSQGRTGYIADNYQFQFDKPAQTGAIYTAGFSACGNNSLALGSSAVFYRCLSGEFYNLYDRHWAAQCSPITFEILPCSGGAAPPNGIGQIGDGQVTGTKVGQPVTQIGDGQVQAPTGVPKAAPVTQIGDGQIQAPTVNPKPVPVTQIGDGQIQAPTKTNKPAPVTQIGDGQIQAPTATNKPAPVTQIGDGQIQAPTGTPSPRPAPVTQIGDGQIQAPVSTAKPAPVTQIADGQIQAPTGTPTQVKSNVTTSAKPTQFTGAASSAGVGSAFAIVVLGVFSSLFL